MAKKRKKKALSMKDRIKAPKEISYMEMVAKRSSKQTLEMFLNTRHNVFETKKSKQLGKNARKGRAKDKLRKEINSYY